MSFAGGGAASAAPGDIVSTLSAQVLAQTFAPDKYTTAPPNVLGRTAMTKQVTADAVWNVDDTGLLATAGRVSTRRGMVMYQPFCGVSNSYLRYGFVDKNHIINVGAAGAFGMGVPFGFLTSITLLDELAVPYNNRRSEDVINMAPRMEDQFQFTLNYGSRCHLVSSTTSTSGADLNGLMSAAAIASTPDVCQKSDGAYSTTSLQQSAVTEADAVWRVPAQQGIIALQGPDIPSEFTPPDSTIRDQLDGIWTRIDGTPGKKPVQLYGGVQPEIVNAGTRINVWEAVASPWNITATTGGFAGVVQVICPATQPSLTAIGERDVFDYDLQIPAIMQNTNAGGAGNALTYSLKIAATHIYISCSSDHELYYTTYGEQFDVDDQGLEGAPDNDPGFNNMGAVVPVASFRPKRFLQSQTGQGKYFCTVFCAYFMLISPNVLGIGPNVVAANWYSQYPGVDPVVYIRAREMGLQRSTGPSRIMRYDQVSDGQVITFKGVVNTLAIAQADLAPFVQGANRLSLQGVDINLLLWLQVLYKTESTHLHRVYAAGDYAKIYDMLFRNGQLSREALTEAIQGNPEAVGGAHASGFFDDLLQAGKSLAGGLVNTGASLLGSAISGLAHAGGEFGVSPYNQAQAAAEFGASANGNFYGGGGGLVCRQRQRNW